MIIQLGFYKRKPGMSTEEFRHYWSEVYGPLYAAYPEISRHLVRYVQHRLSPVVDHPDPPMPFDGFSEAWFKSVAASHALQREPLYIERIAPLAENFLDLENSKLMAYDSQVYQVGHSRASVLWKGATRSDQLSDGGGCDGRGPGTDQQ
jgi:hypothetical protein